MDLQLVVCNTTIQQTNVKEYYVLCLEVVKRFVWWVVVVFKPILVFSFSPNQALGLRL